MTPLSPLDFPLRGSHLIEASAGTGKTFTIALLYVRLILGHGGEQGFTRPLLPPDILVVTFTDAATMELRDRIRARLTEAATCFHQEGNKDVNLAGADPLRALRDTYPSSDWPRCAKQLELAAQWMDEAAISTIHAWCYRMLKEHAFDCQSALVQNLNTHTHELLDESARDYWRIFYYPLSKEHLVTVTQCWGNPNVLVQKISPFLRYTQQLPVTTLTPWEILAQTQQNKTLLLNTLKAPWRDWADQLQQLFDAARVKKLFDGRKLNQKNYTTWLDELRLWAIDDRDTPSISQNGWSRLSPDGIREAWKENAPEHPAFDAMVALKQALDTLPNAQPMLLAHATHWLNQRLDITRQQLGQMGFDDLLNDFHRALAGPHGSFLGEQIRQQFPVALIDEFQDTDPIQYQIIDHIYATANDLQDSGLILIGDPKQAIYRFRGADIYTYLTARQAVGTRLYSLTTNFRATTDYIAALNHIFNRLEQQDEGKGAFLFQRDGHNPIPYVTVQAQGRPQQAWLNEQAIAALTWVIHQPTAPLSYQEQMATACTDTIVTWLNTPAMFKGPQSTLQAVKPKDIAVLVNDRRQSQIICQALALRGVRSVYLSAKRSVYETPQALEIQRWLMACAAPADEGKVRAALATPSLGLSWVELEAVYQNEEQAETRLLQFRSYQTLWQKQGVLPMIRRLMQDFHCHDRLLGLTSDHLGQTGERILTDLLHLAELLQQTSFSLAGEHALLRYLADQIADPNAEDHGPNSQRLRLESEEGLVQVVTIHKSKGLEYPFVFLPFISNSHPVKASDQPFTWHDEQGRLQLALSPHEQALRHAEHERLAEDMRKLYVALTRAQYSTWLGIDLEADSHLSAINRLLGRCTPLDPAITEDDLQALGQGQSMVIITQPTQKLTHHQPHPAPSIDTMRPARRAHPPHYEPWVISSYSALIFNQSQKERAPWADDGTQLAHLIEHQQDLTPSLLALSPASGPVHQFPKGALAGTLFHELMEWIALKGFRTMAENPDQLRDGIALRCQMRGWEAWVDILKDWAMALLTTPLPVAQETIRFDQLSQVKAEVEFWFAADHVDLQQLDHGVMRHTLATRPRPGITEGLLNGLLKGFMDLIFEYNGRYYVADYKTNWLGPSDGYYSADAMEEAMCAHRYDLQSMLYLLALHRLLRSRLPDYDYDRHMGGAIYLFVRGLGSPTKGVYVERPPERWIQQLDALFAGTQGILS